MIVNIFDVESTDKIASMSNMVQVAVARMHVETGVILEAHNMFMWERDWIMKPGAYAVHGLSEDFLLDNRTEINDACVQIHRVFNRANTLGWNNKAFDCHIMIYQQEHYGYKTNFEVNIDLMYVFANAVNHLVKMINGPGNDSLTDPDQRLWAERTEALGVKNKYKLEEAKNIMGITDSSVRMLEEIFFDIEGGTYEHRATFDVMLTYKIALMLKNKGLFEPETYIL